ncbi:MAG TPA: T9SS type A sorting domain-containing protein [Chitinophagaceae bacterium]|nr:T9SS type A sorting domain-containing protein [Chitinophagaceae bacterium]
MHLIYPPQKNNPGCKKNKYNIFILFLLTFVFSLQSFAQNYTLTSSGDTHAVTPTVSALDAGGQITLRSAMEASTQIAGTHIITIPGGIGPTINLTLGQMTVGSAAVGNNITVNGPGMGSLTINQTTDNRVFSTGTGAVTFVLQNLTLNCTAPGATPYSGGGGAIIAGGASAATTLTNVAINNFRSQIGNGGAMSQSSSLNVHTLTITNCSFTNNKCGGAGGAISFNSQGGTATITGCTFNGNHTGVVGANTGGDGGAVATTGGGTGGTYTIEKNTFLNNQVENVTGHAGAVINTNGILTLRFNRFIGNTCLNVANPPLANIIAQTGGTINFANTIADNNWWGVNTGPGVNDATALAAGGTMTLTKWLQLKTTASPNPICNTTPTTLGNTSTVTTSFLSNSASEAIAVGNLTTVIGLPVTWSSTLGSLSGQQATIQAAGTATALFTSNGTAGTATVNTQVDNIPIGETTPARANITVNATSIAPTGATGTTTVCNGGTTTLTVSGGLKGTGAVTQWYTGSCGGVLVFTGDAFLTPALATTTTYFVRYNGTCNTTTCATVIVTVNDVTGGTVGSDQTICSGGDPAAFTQSVASTGSGALTYQWQSSTTSCAAGFSNIGGATATTYDPPAGLAVTTFYRRVTTSTLNAIPCTANSTCITVTINNVTGGTVAADQTICSGGDPAAFTQSVASTGSGALTYQWQSSTTSCAAGFSNIGGATATTYDPPAGLLVTTFYRRVTTSTLTAVPCTANSNCITVTVNDVTGGTVGSDQTVCSSGDPAAFTQSVASTGSGALTYQWQNSITGCGGSFSNIAGATAATYDPPAGLLVTTNYRRATTSTLNAIPCTANSNCITVTVNSVSGGTVATDQTICSGGDPAAFTQSVASTGSGALTYQWQSSTTSCAAGFSNIGGATATTYDPPAGLLVTTFYRRVTTSTLTAVPCTANSNCITVTINNVTGGTVAGNQGICSGGDPAAFTQSVASTGSGALTYQWQSSTTGCAGAFSNIGGATAITYDPPAGLLVTTNYRRVTTSTLNAVPCTANSNCITVTVGNTITLTSAAGTDAQVKAVNTPITPITYSTTMATGALFTGLPPGVNGNWAANVATISGTPTAIGFYNYTVTLTGGCAGPPVTANGSINVTPALPVTLTSFTGKLNPDKTVTLQWKVEDQHDIVQYIVEESGDGNTFSQLGSVPASNGTVNTYSFIDGQVATGNNYYRLKIIELSGRITYSHIVVVNLKAGITVMLYPNPVTGQLTIQQFGTIQNRTAVLSDGQGKILLHIRLTSLQQQVNMEMYPSGVYIVKMENGTVFKVVKQ